MKIEFGSAKNYLEIREKDGKIQIILASPSQDKSKMIISSVEITPEQWQEVKKI